MADADDRALVEGLRRGEDAAFESAWHLYRPRLHSFLLRLGADQALAEELVQETFIRLAEHALRLGPDTRPGAWLFTVARNLFYSSRRRTLGWARLSAWLVRDPPPLPTPADLCEWAEADRRLEEALMALPLAAREILLLVGVEQMERTEVARMLGISNEALRQRLSRARALLAERLGETEVEP
jgi:RNA polymerase sigma-70 factor (ECF subfamily)